MYTEGHKAKDAKKLPLNLLDALRALEKSAVLEGRRSAKTSIASYIKLKTRRLERLFPPSDRMGAPDDARLLSAWCAGMHYSALALAWNALSRVIRTGSRPGAMRRRKRSYDVVIIGGGGHGLATAYYLAKEHGITNVAVLEKSWIGSGNAGRNTTIIRSNYLLPGNTRFYEWSMKLWEGLERDLNYNTMVSQRGVLNIYHSDAQRDAFARRGNAMRLHGVDARAARPRARARARCLISTYDNARFPIQGGLLQRRGGTARHDAVVWGYARAAIRARRRHRAELRSDRHHGRERPRGRRGDHARRHSAPRRSASPSPATARASPPWRACGCRSKATCCRPSSREGIKPLVISVITFGAGHFYISQSDKGGLVFGGDIDGYNSYAQRGNLPTVEDVCEGGMALMPMHRPPAHPALSGAASWTCRWTARRSSITRRSTGLYLNAGWCYGGFKATPAIGLVLCASDRARRAASGCGRIPARPVRHRAT